ncbi:MAG: hydrogenase maturation nickel metallochaperone HypA [Steroidobacteraceae bacterium]|jgi:hydrogenase nickel incorporation protein HypA/HybF
MHEMALCHSLVDLIEAERAARGFAAVSRVRVAIGAFANVEPEALRFGFEIATRGTAVEGAELEFDLVPANAWCMTCGACRVIAKRGDACPDCGGSQLMLQTGEELRLAELEVH